tara:strand:- start:257 stop:481 length:225 start_codon:yes stop_codon:yes gene_type:complete
MTEIETLKVIYCYVNHQINPQKSIPLDYLTSLNISDIDTISEDMFEETVYSKEDVKFMLKELNNVIIKMEKDER